jgi:hypothetical protein
MDVKLAQKFVPILLQVDPKTHNNQATSWLFHLASRPKFASVFQTLSLQLQYLTLPGDSAADLLPLLTFLMKVDAIIMHN